jgi:hypothetical protein
VYISGRGEVLEYIYEDFWGQTGGWGVRWDVWIRLDVMDAGIPCGGRCNGKFTGGKEVIVLFFCI